MTTEHKYKIGETIKFRNGARDRTAASGLYRVVAYRPADDGEHWYLIKSELERHDRVARESELNWTV